MREAGRVAGRERIVKGAGLVVALSILGGCAARAPAPDEAPDYPNAAQVLVADASVREWARKVEKPEETCSLVGATSECPLPEGVSGGEMNFHMTDYYRRREAIARDERTGRPGFCVALSGGGIRSAAFSIGVMQGIADLGLDATVSAISATSGGGYALAWMAHGVASDDKASLSQVLRDEEGLVALDERVELDWDSLPSRVSTLVVSIPSRLVSLYWVLVDQFVRLPLPSVDAPRISYEGMIRLTFLPEKEGYFERAQRVGWWKALSPQNTTVNELRAAVDGKRMPLPIWTSTATVSSPECSAWSFDKHIFEMTPYRQGSHWLGYTDKYHSYGQDLTLLSAVAGAALDSPCITEWRRFLDLAIGRFGSTYPVFYASPLIVDGNDSPKPRTHTTVRLIDGGDSENLAAYPLIRRLCERILIVDATEDPHLVFKSYDLLRKGLGRRGMEFSVDGIDDIARANRNPGIPTPSPACDPANPDPRLCFASRRQPISMFRGRIGDIPFSTAAKPLGIDVLYLKLAMNEASLAAYPEPVRTYWSRCTASENRTTPCQFPQDLTIDQHYSRSRFKAYRELGRHHVTSCIERDGSLKKECRS